MPFVINIIIVS